jgi:hypothetical protein
MESLIFGDRLVYIIVIVLDLIGLMSSINSIHSFQRTGSQ